MAPTPGRSSIGVRVRPNANDFLKDLERQLKTKKKTFYVDVHANLKPANQQIQQWARTTLKNLGAKVSVSADMTPANKDLAAWRARQRGIRTNIPIGADLAKANAEVAAFRKLAGRDIDINLKVSTESANRAAERFQQAMARKGVSVPLNVEPGSVVRAANKIDSEITRRIQQQGGVSIDVDADTDKFERQVDAATKKIRKPKIETELDLDMKRANLKLKQLRAEQLARKLEIDVDVKRSGMDRFSSAMDSIEKRMGNFNFIKSLDFGPVNLGKPGGLMGTLTTVTALAGAVPAAVTAVTALSKALVDMAGAAAIAPGAIGALMASMATFSVGVSGMSDAFDAMIEMWTETPAQAASSARRSVQAHNQLRQAVRDEAQAQRDVGAARREATNDLRNLNNELRGSVLNEAQAILDLQKARDRLAQGGFETSTDLKQAQLDEAKAVDNLINVRERNTQLQQKVNEEGKKGVEGSDKVTEALERQTRASEQAAMALEAIGSTQATSAWGKFQQEIDQLTPNARDFMMVLVGMRGEFMSLRNVVQEDMFAGTAPAFERFLNNMMPVIGPGMRRIAQGMNASILQVFDSLGGPQGQSIIDRILAGTGAAIEKMPALIDPVVRGLGTLMAAGAEHLPQVVDLFTRLADRFANFIENADKTGELDKFMDTGVAALGKMAELGINLIQIVDKLGGAFGGDLLQSLVNVTQKFEDWLGSAEGQTQINEWIQQGKELWEDWKPVLQDLPAIFEAVGDAARTLMGPITTFLNLFTSAMKEAPGLVSAFVGVWLGSKLITGFLSPVAAVLGGIIKGFKALPGLVSAVAGLQVPAWLGGKGGPGGAPGAAPPPVAGAPGKAAPGFKAPGGVGILAALGPGLSPDEVNYLGALPPEKQQEFVDAQKAQDGPKMQTLLKEAFDAYHSQQAQEPWWKRILGFASGGFTNWGVEQGKTVMLHGKEYVQPHDVVSHYGTKAMEAIHQKRVPPQLLQSFWPGGPVPPLSPLDSSMGDLGGTAAAKMTPAPATPAPPTPVTPTQHGAGPAMPGPTGPASGVGTGPAPGPIGPVPTTAGVDPLLSPSGVIGPAATTPPVDFMGIPIPGMTQQPGGWPNGAPPGLGGGPDGFDIRRFGIGPGPVGSGPGDWMNWGGEFAGNFFSKLGSTLLGGFLGFFGAEGLLNNPYFSAGKGLVGHFANSPGINGSQVQGPGAAQTNAHVDQSLATYYNMPQNPTHGAPGSMPQVWQSGDSHGVPAGSEISYGSEGFPDWVYQIADKYGVEASTYSGHQEGRGVNQGIDWRPKGYAVNSPEGAAIMDRFAQALQTAPGVEQIIWENPITGERQGRDPGDRGANQTIDDYYRSNWAGHRDHVHTRHSTGLYVMDTPNGPAFMTQSQAQQLPPGMNPVPAQQYAAQQSSGDPGLDSLNEALSMPFGTDPATPSGGHGPLAMGVAGQGPTGASTGSMAGGRTGGGPVMTGQMGTIAGSGATVGNDKEALKAIAKRMYLQSGMPPAEWPAFDRLIQKESSWNPTAKNPSSTAYGLGQFLDITDAQYGPRSPDPMVQLPRIFQYIRDRYNGSPAKALNFHNANNWYDRGGWLMPGQSTVDNATGKPELVVPWDKIPAFYNGGLNDVMKMAATRPRPPSPGKSKARPPVPMPPPPSKSKPPVGPAAPARPSPIAQAPVTPPPMAAAPPTVTGPAAPPAPAPSMPNLGTPDVPTVQPAQIGTGPGPGGGDKHLHPAASKGIQAGAAAIGSLANSAVAAATMGATMGMGGGIAGGMGGGMGGLSIGGLIQQGGKIVEGIANVGASFLVGTLTSGTTENPYGVTQRASNPTGGTRIVDNSQKYGDVYTQSPREFFKQLDLRDAQKSQGSLGGYDRYA